MAEADAEKLRLAQSQLAMLLGCSECKDMKEWKD